MLRDLCTFYISMLFKGAIFEGPTTTIAHPGDDVELVCNVTSQFTTFVLWIVNGNLFTRNQLFNGDLPGHNISGTNILILDITLGDSRNGSEYYCVIPQGIVDIESDRAFLYVAGELTQQVTCYASISCIACFSYMVMYIWSVCYITAIQCTKYYCSVECTHLVPYAHFVHTTVVCVHVHVYSVLEGLLLVDFKLLIQKCSRFHKSAN